MTRKFNVVYGQYKAAQAAFCTGNKGREKSSDQPLTRLCRMSVDEGKEEKKKLIANKNFGSKEKTIRCWQQ